MALCKVGVQFHPQDCTIDQLRDGWKAADAMGVDSIWVWDHFYPLYGNPDAAHFEGWSLLAAIACETTNAQFGALVGCNSYRNPELLADMSRTIDHLSGGRFILGIGSGWFERDYDEYGYEFGTAFGRLTALGESLPRIKSRLSKLNPPPVGAMPIMIGGGGEKVTLRLVAEYADMWNVGSSPSEFKKKSAILDEWCAKVGRDPKAVERTVMLSNPTAELIAKFIDAGAEHVIVSLGPPFDLGQVEIAMTAAQK
ncbi:MAG: LLM class F420-dependent oxidoreductase [Actinobacteria bacterium]|nr:LLM class F420-dependent oxidoreductase [Actinomycetota bacterium]